MLRLSATTKAILFAIVGFILLFMYTPLFVLILNSFNESQISGWPIESFSTKWWEFAKDYQPIRSALLNSLLVAMGAMIIASILGTLVAFAIKGFDIAMSFRFLPTWGQFANLPRAGKTAATRGPRLPRFQGIHLPI